MPPKRRKRFQGLYYHSSPPKVMPMNGKEGSQNGRKKRDGDDFSVKLSTIRIWMHEKDVGKLTRILWAGQGNRLCQQASNNGRMKRFLAAVPHVMNAIKDVHQAVIDNNLETLQAKLEPPVPPAMVTCKDANGLNIIHKAAGLGHTKILEYIIGIWPEGAHETDVTGKTPLHWAASAKNNMRCYTLLTQAGCDEEALDYKMKSPSYYRHKPHEIERAFLVYVPEAPRVSPDSTTDWEALSTENENGTETKKLDIKLPEANGINGRSVEDSIENTSELDLNDGVSANEEEDELSKDELSQNLENGKNSPKKPATPPEPETTNEVNNENESNNTEDKENENNEETQDEKNRTNDLNEDEVSKDNGGDDDVKEENEVDIDKAGNGDDQQAEEIIVKEEKADDNEEKEYENEEFETEAEGEGEKIDSHVNENEEIKEKENENGGENDNENGGENDDENGNENNVVNAEEELPKETEEENVKLSPAASNEEIDKTEDDNDAKEDDNVDEIIITKQFKGNKQLIQDHETGEKMCIKKDTTEEIESENEVVTSKDVNENHIKDIEEKNNDNDNHNDDGDDGEDDDEDVIEIVTNTMNNTNNSTDDKYMNNDDASSPTSSLAIEGFVQGESEDNTVQSQTAAYNDHDDDDQDDDNNDEESHIKRIISNGDMEQLAEIVLNGDGNKLLEMKSKEPEIQAFLNNVPTYMSKIRRVHDAARDGSLLSLQQALDRRKFAVAKDEISPNGATPLHVAVLFGNSDIVRYLAARFPETMNSIDNNGRTALHYAATINDNGHFYNILVQLGSNTKALDKFGHTPEYILSGSDPTSEEENDDLLNYNQLLKEFGAEELETQLLNDQVPDDLHSARRELQEGEISRTLERCFNVIQESSKALSGSSASALAQRKPLSASSLQVSVTSYLSRFLKRKVYDKIKKRQTRLDHNLFDVLWPAMRKTSKTRFLEEDINCGIIAPDFDVFVVFQEFLVPLLKDMHCLSIDEDFKPHKRIAYFPMQDGERLNTADFVFDDESHLVTRCIVECSRNLDQMELPLNLTIGQIEHAERLMMAKIFTSAFADAIGEVESGSYYTMNEILEETSDVMDMLTNYGLMIPMLDTKDLVQAAESTAFNGSLWPYGRGVYVNSENNLALWINCQEHLRIISTTNSKEPADMGSAYSRVGRAVSFLETQLHFKESYLLGYLQSRPAYLGTGLKMTTIIKLPNLMKEMDNLRHLCSVRGLSLVTNRLSRLTVRLINMQSMGAAEHVLFQDYCTAVTNILSLEKDMSLSNSKHIATMLVKIFRRKKNSIVDEN